MSLTLRIICVFGAALTFYCITNQVRKSKIKIEDSLFWVILSGLLLLVAIFPRIAFYVSRLLGFQAPSNFIFLATIGLLMVKEFHTTTQLSQLKHRVNDLAQEIALLTHEEEQNEKDR